MATWIRKVDRGQVVAGRYMRLAVRRHLHDLKYAGRRGFVFNEDVANEAIWFIESCCVHTKNSVGARAGDPLILTPSQRFIVWSLIGWRRRSDGLRRFKKAFIEVARKFGKSTFAASLALYLLVFDNPLEESAEIYAAATKEAQARIVFNEAKAMTRRSKPLRKRLQPFTKSLLFARTQGFFQPIGSDSDGTDGLNTSGVVMDEIHAWQKKHRGLYEKLVTAGGARLQPLWIMITTAGDDRSQLWQQEHDYAVRVVESVVTGEIVDDAVFALICALDYPNEHPCLTCNGTGKAGRGKCRKCRDGIIDPDDPFDSKVWVKANPNIGSTVAIDKIVEMANEAKNRPEQFNAFLRYVCNVKVSSSVKAIAPEVWEQCAGPVDAQPGDYCCGAFDLGRSDDWAAWSLVFPVDYDGDDDETLRFELLSRSYTCEARAETLEGDMFQRWIESGQLVVHDGDQVDFNAITADIVEQSRRYSVESWAYDPTFAQQIGQTLLNDYGINVFRFGQSFRFYNEPVRTFMRLLKKGLISHGGDPVLSWQAGNLAIKRNMRDEWMPDKPDSQSKIDAMVSVFMAISECLFHEQEEESVYESRGLRTF